MVAIQHMALSALKQLPFPKKTTLKRLRKIFAYSMDLFGEAMNSIFCNATLMSWRNLARKSILCHLPT